MNKGVFFDFDGTLLDSLPDITYYVNIMLDKYNLNKTDTEEVKCAVGFGARHLVKTIVSNRISVSDKTIDEMLAYYVEMYAQAKSEYSKVYDGIKEVLIELKKRDYKVFIMTNKPQNQVDRICSLYFNDFSFDKIIGQSSNTKCKPDPTETLKAIKDFNLDKEKTFFVGDGEADVQTALNSNIKCISVLWGYRDKEVLLKLGSKIFINTPNELLNLIK